MEMHIEKNLGRPYIVRVENSDVPFAVVMSVFSSAVFIRVYLYFRGFMC